MGLIDKILYFSSLVFRCDFSSRLVYFSEEINGLSWLLIHLKKQQVKIAPLLETSNQVQIFLLVQLKQRLVEFNVVGVWV